MNKSELISVIAERTGETKIVTEGVLDAFVSVVGECLANDEKVVLTGFGTFEVRKRAGRSGRNPRTGEVITIPEQLTPAFKAGKVLKDQVK